LCPIREPPEKRKGTTTKTTRIQNLIAAALVRALALMNAWLVMRAKLR